MQQLCTSAARRKFFIGLTHAAAARGGKGNNRFTFQIVAFQKCIDDGAVSYTHLFLGIRLIAVTDNFDSTRKEDMESLALPIRNMVNAMYAKDNASPVTIFVAPGPLVAKHTPTFPVDLAYPSAA